MTVESLMEVFRAHLALRELSLVDGLGRPLDQFATAYALRELAEVAKDAMEVKGRWERTPTLEIPVVELDTLRAQAAQP